MKKYLKKYTRKNTYFVEGGIAYLTITRRSGAQFAFKFDADRLDEVRHHLWSVRPKPPNFLYAGSGGGGRKRSPYISLGRLIARTPDSMECSYIDHDTCNCLSENLRNGTRHDSMTFGRRAKHPKSGVTNVSWVGWGGGQWAVSFHVKGTKGIRAGHYLTVEEAVVARDQYLAEHPELVTSKRRRAVGVAA